jgi:hypothetical protein
VSQKIIGRISNNLSPDGLWPGIPL